MTRNQGACHAVIGSGGSLGGDFFGGRAPCDGSSMTGIGSGTGTPEGSSSRAGWRSDSIPDERSRGCAVSHRETDPLASVVLPSDWGCSGKWRPQTPRTCDFRLRRAR